MLFLTLLRVKPAHLREAMQEIRQFGPQPDVSIVARYGLFGTPDAVVLYDAPSSESAMDFVAGVLCKLPGVTDSETYPAIGLGDAIPAGKPRWHLGALRGASS